MFLPDILLFYNYALLLQTEIIVCKKMEQFSVDESSSVKLTSNATLHNNRTFLFTLKTSICENEAIHIYPMFQFIEVWI